MNAQDSFRRRRRPMQEEIAILAYAIYEREGRPEGKAWDHWFNAESMIESQFGEGGDHAEPQPASDGRE